MRILIRSAMGLGLALLLAIRGLGKCATRVAFGGGMGSVEVSRVVVARLKGNKEAYYPDGTMVVDCSRSLFQQAAVDPAG